MLIQPEDHFWGHSAVLKGHSAVLENTFNLNSLNVYQWGNNTNSKAIILFHNWLNKLFSEEKAVLKLCFKKVAASATCKQQYETVLSFKSSLFIQSWQYSFII